MSRYEDHIRDLVDQSPPLSDDQRARLRMLLAYRPGGQKSTKSDLVPEPLAVDSLREVLDRG